MVYVRMGDKTAADLLVFSASDCKVDNSSLTGESEPQDRAKDNDMTNPLEASNLMFNSTLAISGEAYGIVIRTGDSTVLGQIAYLTAGEDKMVSPLSREIDNFVKLIATIAIITALIFFGASTIGSFVELPTGPNICSRHLVPCQGPSFIGSQ